MVETEPKDIETRAEFLSRLRRQVNWMNETKHSRLLLLCTNQKVRANEVEDLLGAKCKW
jgi:hypothetical protein